MREELLVFENEASGESASADTAQVMNVATMVSIAEALLAQGTVIGNRYKLKTLMWPGGEMDELFKDPHEMGRGNFGAAYLANDVNRGDALVVVKLYFTEQGGLLNKGNAKSGDDKMRLWMAGREVIGADLIQNAKEFPAGRARFMRCLENGLDNANTAYVVWEYLGRTNLRQYLDAIDAGEPGFRQLDVFDLSRMTKQLLEGLAQIQDKYVHRDIKPENIMIQVQPGSVDVWYIDFGTITDAGKRADTNAGSPAWMPPESYRGSFIPTSKFDVWSVGNVLYDYFCRAPLIDFAYQTQNGNLPKTHQMILAGQAKPKEYCPGPKDEGWKSLYNFIVDNMMAISPDIRADAVSMLQHPGWANIQSFDDADAYKYPAVETAVTTLPALPAEKGQSELSRLLHPSGQVRQAVPKQGIFAKPTQEKQKAVYSHLKFKGDPNKYGRKKTEESTEESGLDYLLSFKWLK